MINIFMIFFDERYPAKSKEIRNQTFSWLGSDTYKRFRKNQPNPYTEHDITYKLNENGFRCDSFVPTDHRLVFLGCSITEGIGLPLEETFAHRVYIEVKKRIGIDFPYWNIAVAGCGLDSIVRCYYNLHKKLSPQVVIAIFPSYRLEYFKMKTWMSALVNFDLDQIFSRNPYLLDKNVIEYSTEKNLAMLDLMLSRNKSMFIWDRWDEPVFENVDTSRLENFKNFLDCWLLAVERAGPAPMARDGIHPGGEIHNQIAKIILDRYGDEICDRLVNGAP